MADLKSSASARYDAGAAGKRLVLEVDDSPSLVKGPGESFVRAFPSSATPKITAVMGGATKVATNVAIDVVDYVSFDGTSSGSLKYYPLGAVKVEEERFFKSEPTIAYDEASNSLRLSEVAYGIVRISYTAAYDRYRVTHGDSPCKAATTQTEGDTNPDEGTVYYDPAFLVAEATGWTTASITVSGPACEGQGGYNNTADVNDYEPVGLKVEEDEGYPSGIWPAYFSADKMPNGFTLAPQTVVTDAGLVKLYAGCKVRVYPKVAVSVIGANCAVSGGPVGSGVKSVLTALTFSGAHSVGLPYPPSSAVSLGSRSATAIDLFGNTVDVTFRLPGEWVNEVEWTDSNTFTLTIGSRQVREDEVVVVTSVGNNTIPCFTFCDVQYTSEYNLYDALFDWDDDVRWYKAGMVLAVASDNRRGSVELRPSNNRGVL